MVSGKPEQAASPGTLIGAFMRFPAFPLSLRSVLALHLALGAAGLAPAAFARPALVAADPAADAAVTKPTVLTLTFSEALDAPLSGLDLVMTAMPGMAHHQPMPIKGFPVKVEDRRIAAALPRALPAGTYLLTWHAAGADRDGATGSYSFTVR